MTLNPGQPGFYAPVNIDITVGSTAARISRTFDVPFDEVLISADASNTDIVFIGNEGEQSYPLANGLTPPASIKLRKVILSLIYARSNSGNQTLHVISSGRVILEEQYAKMLEESMSQVL